MEKLRKVVNQIAYKPRSQILSTCSPLQLSLIPFLCFASNLYERVVSLRHQLYRLGLFSQHQLPVPVISVGNLTWGGNGKTPMVEFIAVWLADSGISPLVLTRGYSGGDEAKMLQRHLLGTSAKIGVGANRAATAACFLKKHGFIDTYCGNHFQRLDYDQKMGSHLGLDKIGAAILDDGMQHLSLWRDLEIVMVNGMMPWGNHHLLPLGPLREPLTALRRADVVVIHHADLVSEQNIKILESRMRNIKESLPIFYTKMAPSYFFMVGISPRKLPLTSVCDMIVLCISAIGFPNAFVQAIEKMGPLHVDQIDFSDHHLFECEDIEMIKMRLQKLQIKFHFKPIVVVTEKDYDRNPEILGCLVPFEVLVLCSELQVVPRNGCTEACFKGILRHLLEIKCRHKRHSSFFDIPS